MEKLVKLEGWPLLKGISNTIIYCFMNSMLHKMGGPLLGWPHVGAAL